MSAPKAKKESPKEVKRKKLDAVADRFSAFRPASEVLTRVEAVPTILVQLDHLLRVGGWPIKRTALIHGPSSEGKSTLLIALLGSFLRRRHRALMLDAERSTPIDYIESLLGADVVNAKDDDGRPLFFADKPDTYEAAIRTTRDFCNAMIDLRKWDPLACGIIGVDSYRKLIPKDVLKEVLAEIKQLNEDEEKEKKTGRGKPKGEITVGRDRRGQIIAKMNAGWMDEICPLIDKAGVAFVGIAREMVDPDADQGAKDTGWDFKIGGGLSLFFEASIVARVERSWIYEKGDKAAGEKRAVYGEKHRVVVWKTKVAGKDDRKVVGFFHTSNGKLTPAGLDRARDVFELAVRIDTVKQAGSWFSFGKKRLGQGEEAVLKKLAHDEVLLAEVEAATRAKFMTVDPVEADEEGVVE